MSLNKLPALCEPPFLYLYKGAENSMPHEVITRIKLDHNGHIYGLVVTVSQMQFIPKLVIVFRFFILSEDWEDTCGHFMSFPHLLALSQTAVPSD